MLPGIDANALSGNRLKDQPKPPPPGNVDDLRRRITQLEAELPKRMRDCAAYVLGHTEQIAFDTVAETATGAGVAPSAMIRFAKTLGFSGYSELQRVFRAGLNPARPNYQSRLAALREVGADSPESLLADFSEAARASIERFADDADPAMLTTAVEILNASETVHVVGYRRSVAVASHIAYLLRQLGRPALMHTGADAIEAKPLIRSGDAVVAISFAPYTPATIELAEEAKARGARIIALTDFGLSPLSQLADAPFRIREEEVGGFRSFAATFCLAATICVAAGASSGSR